MLDLLGFFLEVILEVDPLEPLLDLCVEVVTQSLATSNCSENFKSRGQ
jgi:hypothetical protein